MSFIINGAVLRRVTLRKIIIAEKEYQARQSDVVRFRVSPEDKNKIEKQALIKGFSSVSEYLRNLALGV